MGRGFHGGVYQLHQGKAKKFEKATFSARGCFDSVTRTREGRLIKNSWMCFIYINGVCNVNAALISISGEFVCTHSFCRPVRARAHIG